MSDYVCIGQAAHAAGLSPSTIRYYEGIDLLPPPSRTKAGYRLYSRDDLARLRFVKRAKLLGLSLDEIKDIATYAVDGHCGPLQHHLASLLEAKIAEVDERVRELCCLKEDLVAYHRTLAQRSRPLARGDDSVNQAFCQCLDGP